MFSLTVKRNSSQINFFIGLFNQLFWLVLTCYSTHHLSWMLCCITCINIHSPQCQVVYSWGFLRSHLTSSLKLSLPKCLTEPSRDWDLMNVRTNPVLPYSCWNLSGNGFYFPCLWNLNAWEEPRRCLTFSRMCAPKFGVWCWLLETDTPTTQRVCYSLALHVIFCEYFNVSSLRPPWRSTT